MAADIIELPRSERLCGECCNALLSTDGVYCKAYRETVWVETEAEACPVYDDPDY